MWYSHDRKIYGWIRVGGLIEAINKGTGKNKLNVGCFT